MTSKQISTWTAGVIGAGTVIGLALWGVPTYLKSQVHDLYAAEAEAAGIPAGVTTNGAAIQAMQIQLNGIELRMIERDKIQAQRDAVIMQYFADKAGGN